MMENKHVKWKLGQLQKLAKNHVMPLPVINGSDGSDNNPVTVMQKILAKCIHLSPGVSLTPSCRELIFPI